VLDVLKLFLLIDATDRSKISSDRCRISFDVNLYPLSFFANTPFKIGNGDFFLTFNSDRGLKGNFVNGTLNGRSTFPLIIGSC